MAQRVHGTLVANTVATVDLTAPAEAAGATADRNFRTLRHVEVVNRGPTGDIFFTVDGSAPTVAGDDTYAVMPGGGIDVDIPAGDDVAIKLISSATPTYSVGGKE